MKLSFLAIEPDRRLRSRIRRTGLGLAATAALVSLLTSATPLSHAAESTEQERTMSLGDFRIVAPKDFERQRPRSQIIAYEFSSPAAEGDAQGGRLTVMAAGGTVDANLERWYGQFTQTDGGSTKEAAKVEKLTVAGQKVHLADISGTFDDKPAPFAPGVKRENYRMLGAIVETTDGNFYVKFYGPRKTIDAQREAFVAMLKNMAKP